MLNFDFRPPGKRCSHSERPLLPGEEFFSVLIDENGETTRLDYAVENWHGPPENCLGWWKSRVPEIDQGKMDWAPREVLLAFFEHLQQQPNQADATFLLALLLAQKKILTMKETFDAPNQDLIFLENKKDKTTYQIPVVTVSPSRFAEIQQQLSEKLFIMQEKPISTDDENA